MKRAPLLFLGSLILLLNCSEAKGQGCATSLTPHFSVYISISRDGTNIHTSVTMQGYANVTQTLGCNMNRATHKAGALNLLGNTGGWNYSASGCPTCYFSVTNNQSIDGNPGTTYTWGCDGNSVCSLAGEFWSEDPGCPSIPGCVVPSSETTQVVRVDPQNATVTEFSQGISDTAGDSFDGTNVREDNAATAQDTCWRSWSNKAQVTGVTQGNWPVAGGEVAGQHNTWGIRRCRMVPDSR